MNQINIFSEQFFKFYLESRYGKERNMRHKKFNKQINITVFCLISFGV